jgi:V8-like Glu-specific endopeptidase
MGWSLFLSNLQEILSDLYPSTNDAVRVGRESGLPIKLISQSEKAINTWHNVLVEADRRDCVDAILKVATRDYPDSPALQLAIEGNLRGVPAPKVDDAILWKASQSPEDLEKIIGRTSTLMPVSFFELGVARSKGVVRITRRDGARGTGFLVRDGLILTNNHVLSSPAEAKSAIVHFNCQQSSEGLDLPVDEYSLNPDDAFVTDVADDWTAVRVVGDPATKWDPIPISPRDIRVSDRVNIIQHPEGGPKKVGIAHNLVVYVGHGRVQYLTDTLPGSSGAPVFNDSWELVAIHHSGGYISEPGTTHRRYRNEGIAAILVFDGMRAAGISLP